MRPTGYRWKGDVEGQRVCDVIVDECGQVGSNRSKRSPFDSPHDKVSGSGSGTAATALTFPKTETATSGIEPINVLNVPRPHSKLRQGFGRVLRKETRTPARMQHHAMQCNADIYVGRMCICSAPHGKTRPYGKRCTFIPKKGHTNVGCGCYYGVMALSAGSAVRRGEKPSMAYLVGSLVRMYVSVSRDRYVMYL